MGCEKIQDPSRKARCVEAQRLLKKEAARQERGRSQRASAGKGNNRISGTMNVGHGMTRDSLTFNDGSVRKILKNKKL